MSELLKKVINNPGQSLSRKRLKNNIKPVIFTAHYNPLGPNINSVTKKHLSIITDNPNLIKIFSRESKFCAYKMFPNLRGIMVGADPYSTKPLKEVDQDPGCNDCMKR